MKQIWLNINKVTKTSQLTTLILHDKWGCLKLNPACSTDMELSAERKAHFRLACCHLMTLFSLRVCLMRLLRNLAVAACCGGWLAFPGWGLPLDINELSKSVFFSHSLAAIQEVLLGINSIGSTNRNPGGWNCGVVFNYKIQMIWNNAYINLFSRMSFK